MAELHSGQIQVASLHSLPPESDFHQIVTPDIAGTPIPRLTIAAAKSGTTAVGTMDTSPTEAEVLALMQTMEFDEADNVRSVELDFVAAKPASCAALCILARVNGNDLPEDANALALGYDDVIEVKPNQTKRINSSVAITKLSVVAVPSGVTSADYEGAVIFLKGISHA